MNDEFARVLQKQMDFFNSPSADSILQVSGKIDDVKDVMIQNIDKILENEERLELLVDKTEVLQTQAFMFSKSAKKLKLVMYWNRFRLYIFGISLVIVSIWLISILICGIQYSQC